MAQPHLVDRLLRRELGDDRFSRYSSVQGLYGDRRWISELDIVNKLRGHTGCVNALSWSRSGEFLASGSDDTTVILHRYSPTESLQFEEVGSIFTGHTQNIFSVKFMPHSNDRTIITAARDSQVRIFDVEYSGRTSATVTPSSSSYHSVGFGSWSMTAGDEDTNVKVFRSHSESVKRIVTEGSPFYFLTCSEDGDVRQWDIRLPSTAYPSTSDSGSAPPPLISYKRQGIQLNTISCSPSQPHYIALGGDHLHCFLHDRRFLGRNIPAEQGAPGSSSSVQGRRYGEEVSKATNCVVRFAPGGRRRMKSSDNRQITACKISDAYPNELIVSWTGNSIYSFDIIRGLPQTQDRHGSRESKHGKRKRQQAGSFDSYDGLEQATARLRTESTHSDSDEDIALRVQNGGSQHEDDPIEADTEIDVTKNQRAHQIAAELVNIRNKMFLLEHPASAIDLTRREHIFSSVVQSCARIIPIVDAAITSWQHPDSPTTSQIAQRNGQAAARRFLQATGLLARVLGGKLSVTGELEDENHNARTIQQYYTVIGPTATEEDSCLLQNERTISTRAQFCYDFLKAICLWLDSGLGALLHGFSTSAGRGKRFPVRRNASMTAVEAALIPYLERLASDRPIMDVDKSKFHVQESRVLFETEKDAVAAFAKAVLIPFADLVSDEPGSSSQSGENETQARRTALEFWAFKVGRGVLMSAARLEPEATFLDHSFTKKVFGGTGPPSAQVDDAERDFLSRHEDIDDSIPSDSDDEDTEPEDDDYGDYSDEEEEERYASIYEQHRNRRYVDEHTPCHSQNRTYTGHINVKTIKDVNFFGRNDEYVVSGSDCGNLFIWDKKTTRIVNILDADNDVANVPAGVAFFSYKPEFVQVAAHPYEPMLAISGIDHTIKIFSADAKARQNARDGVAISHPPRRPHAPPLPPRAPRSTWSDEEEEEIARNGLKSRKRLHEEYTITAKNAQAASAAEHEPRLESY
ncbi:WD40 repeat-like protein [Lophium mytilinum]|uniref:WD40 repeat-like protein n=1 Tax=Lophium mytilinum TaxID=390894 RepID=A0A6A6Q8I2_9PEZI|nr:WD40 repeat-like protein [Lophium mytilinum]